MRLRLMFMFASHVGVFQKAWPNLRITLVGLLLSIQMVVAHATEKQAVLRAVTSDVNYPYNYVKEGQVRGLSVDVAQELARRLDMRLEIEVLPWTRALHVAQTEANVLVFTVAKIPEREANYHWIGPVTHSEEWLFKLKRRDEIKVRTLSDVKAYLVGDEANNASIPLLQRLGVKIDLAPSMTSNCRKFKVGRVDLIPFDADGIMSFANECGLELHEIEKTVRIPRDGALYFAFGKSSSPDLMHKVKRAFAAMIRDKSLLKLTAPWKINSPKSKAP